MCLAVYIASNKELPLIAWDESQPKFNVTRLSSTEKIVLKQFKTKNVVYVGSEQGCGCGFFKEGETGEDLIKAQSNYDELAKYLNLLKEDNVIFEIYSCWEGDQGAKPEFIEKITINNLISPEFEFKEKAYYEIV